MLMEKEFTCLNCGIKKSLKKNSKGKYCNNTCQFEYQNKKRIKDFLEGKYKGKRLLYAKGRWNRVLLEKTFGEKCNCCGIGNEWIGKPITLEVNHIDGKAYNNILSNLEFLCPNCHSQTKTFRAKNKNSDRSFIKKPK